MITDNMSIKDHPVDNVDLTSLSFYCNNSRLPADTNILSFTTYHQNIRSMRENFDRLTSYLFSNYKFPAIIFLTEIWIYDNEISSYQLPGFNCVSCCNNNYRAGGVCAYYDSRLNCSYEATSLSSVDILKLTISFHNEIFVFVCVYRLQFISESTFISEFSEFIGKVKCKNLIVLGDMNVDILNCPPSSDDYMCSMASFGLESLINCPTRIFRNSSSCIDHCFARLRRNDLSTIKIHCLDLSITDHCLIQIDFRIPLCNNFSIDCNEKESDVVYDKLNTPMFNLAISNSNFSDIFIDDPSTSLSKLVALFNSVTSSCTSTIIKRASKVKIKPWISDYLVNLINKKKKIVKKFKKHPNNVSLRNYINKVSYKIDVQISIDKSNYFNNKFNYCGNDSKKNWYVVNEILSNSNSNRQKIDKILSENSLVLNESALIANDFSSYFGRIIRDLRFHGSFSGSSLITSERYISDTFFIDPVDVGEIACIIKSLKSSNSIDILGISTNMLKDNIDIITPALVHIINNCFCNGIVPDILKTAIIIPLHKKGDRLNKDNYRPIALQPTILKIMEKALKCRINSFLNKYDILSDKQFGFRAGSSTETALVEYLNRVHSQLNEKLLVGTVFIDIKRAFDMVDHNLLLKKLFSLGFRGIAHKWFSSYLDNRSYMVRIDNSYSTRFRLEYGVPQGSVLGPLLFLIYINDIFDLPISGSITAFADDMALTYCSMNAAIISNDINNDLRVLRSWFNEHFMILSEKTKVMFFKLQGDPLAERLPEIFYHSMTCNLVDCSIDCLKLELVNSFKYLGLQLDSNLNWKGHVLSLKQQLYSVLRALYLLRSYCPSSVLLQFYHACAGSRINYGIVCWGGTYKNTLQPLLTLQNHLVRVMFFKSRRDSAWPIYSTNRILPLQHLYIFRVLRLFFSRSGHRPFRLITAYDLRINYRNIINPPNFTTTAFSRYYLCTGPLLFNRLPMYVRFETNLAKFLVLVKDFLFENKDVGFLFSFCNS